jgi:hypothetical protein
MASAFLPWARTTRAAVGSHMVSRRVQHLLLDQAETQALEDARLRAAHPDGEEPPADPAPALSEELLLACLPALCLPEPADLSSPPSCWSTAGAAPSGGRPSPRP